jgi:hypothetical protein
LTWTDGWIVDLIERHRTRARDVRMYRESLFWQVQKDRRQKEVVPAYIPECTHAIGVSGCLTSRPATYDPASRSFVKNRVCPCQYHGYMMYLRVTGRHVFLHLLFTVEGWGGLAMDLTRSAVCSVGHVMSRGVEDRGRNRHPSSRRSTVALAVE